MKKRLMVVVFSFGITLAMIYLAIPHFFNKEKLDVLNQQLEEWNP